MKFYIVLALLATTGAIRLTEAPAAAAAEAPAAAAAEAPAEESAGKPSEEKKEKPAAEGQGASEGKAEGGDAPKANDHFGTAQDHALTAGQAVAASVVSAQKADEAARGAAHGAASDKYDAA